jgi:hypothetical protein
MIHQRNLYMLLGCCSLLSVSCLNPFAPKLDSSLASQTCGDLTQIENVFCTVRNAYSFKDTAIYGSLLAPNFIFIYTDYEQVVERNWGRDDEMHITYRLFQNVQSLSLVWNSQLSFSESDTMRTVERGYNLTVTFDPNNIERVDGVGEFVFTRARAGDSWKILRWQDKSNF